MWVKKEWPWIDGMDTLGNVVSAKQWQGCLLKEFISLDLDDLCRFYALCGKKLQTREDVCEFVISEFDYPMAKGSPCDTHENNWFQGLCHHKITCDFWQLPRETLQTLALNQRLDKKGYGDCEDTSLLFTSLFLIHGWEAWECFGQVVYEGGVGGHGWSFFLDDNSIPRLYESTLDTPPAYPNKYPVIDPNSNVWQIGGVKYIAFIKFTKPNQCYEWELGGIRMGLKEYLKLKLKDKAKLGKFKALQEAWGTPVKPIKNLGLLSKIRWRE